MQWIIYSENNLRVGVIMLSGVAHLKIQGSLSGADKVIVISSLPPTKNLLLDFYISHMML